MAPEYGATCGFFPVDDDTLDYLTTSGRTAERVALVEAYAKAQGMFRDDDAPEPVFTDTLELDLSTGRALDFRPEAPAGPRRPVPKADEKFATALRRRHSRKADGAAMRRTGRGRRLRS